MPLRDPIIYTGEPLPRWEVATSWATECKPGHHFLRVGAIYRINNDLRIECCACAVARTKKEVAA